MSVPRRILVTGAASGVGAALCRRIARPDTHLFIHTRRNREGAEKVATEVGLAGGVAEIDLVDLSDRGAGRGLVKRAALKLGGLDVLVANAGYALRKPALEAGDDAFEAAHGTMSRSFFEMATAAIPRRQGEPLEAPQAWAVTALGTSTGCPRASRRPCSPGDRLQ